MKRICICCGEAITSVGLNPNTCLDCESMLDNDFPNPGTSVEASAPVQTLTLVAFDQPSRHGTLSPPKGAETVRNKTGIKTHGWTISE
jgi:hypothetical protein